MFVVKRSGDNPIFIPNRDHYWEEFAAFNMCPIKKGKTIHGLYRAISAFDHIRDPHQMSVIGIAKSKDGTHFEKGEQFITPEFEWEQYGCEDPRVTYFEGKYYVFYTALSKYPFGPEGIKVAVAVSKDLKKVDEKHFVTPFNSKAMSLFPERIDGKITVIFSSDTDKPPARMTIAQCDHIEELWSPGFWEKWHKDMESNMIDPRRTEYDHVEVGAPPVKTKYGWLLVYSHIQNYFHKPENQETVFGIEAMLLDLSDPRKIIGKTRGPILVPEETYELSGYVSNVIFPTGAMIEGDLLTIYYGAADTTVCTAKVSLEDLIASMLPDLKSRYRFLRYEKNPTIKPSDSHGWESKSVCNPAAIDLDGKVHIVYRALSENNTSVFGYASSINGLDIDERLPDPIYVPREEFEDKKIENGNSGCEDPRLTKIGSRIYVCYTAFDGIGPARVATSSISEKDFLNKKWNWEKPFMLTPRDVDDKDTCILSERFKGGYFVIHRINYEICGDYVPTLDGKSQIKKCIRIMGPRQSMWDSSRVGITAPPVKTKYGWLLLYHGASKSHNTYRVGAVLLDLKDPAIVLARSTDAIFEPETDYEKFGIVNNVVFPCGLVIRKVKVGKIKKDIIYIYYGGADKVVGVATMDLDVILNSLRKSMKY